MAVKTTLNLDERLLARAKALALREGTTLTALVEQALQARLAPRSRRGNAGEFTLPVAALCLRQGASRFSIETDAL